MTASPYRRHAGTKKALVMIAGAVLVVFCAANAHLVYVAFRSDPGCVAHHRTASNRPGVYRAAKSAC